jgi:hypothetical protein
VDKARRQMNKASFMSSPGMGTLMVRVMGGVISQIKYTPASGTEPASLKVVDHWTPQTDLVRTGKAPKQAMKLAGMNAPSESDADNRWYDERRDEIGEAGSMVNDRGVPTLLVYPQMAAGAWSDEDWGSVGPACILPIGVCIAAGKDGIAYPVKTAALGGTTLDDLANPKANCAKRAAPPAC